MTWPGWALLKFLLGWRLLCLDKSVKSSLLSTGWVLAGPLYRRGEEATTESREAPSLTGVGLSFFRLSLWK